MIYYEMRNPNYYPIHPTVNRWNLPIEHTETWGELLYSVPKSLMGRWWNSDVFKCSDLMNELNMDKGSESQSNSKLDQFPCN